VISTRIDITGNGCKTRYLNRTITKDGTNLTLHFRRQCPEHSFTDWCSLQYLKCIVLHETLHAFLRRLFLSKMSLKIVIDFVDS
jgi:hypothetical protein